MLNSVIHLSQSDVSAVASWMEVMATGRSIHIHLLVMSSDVPYQLTSTSKCSLFRNVISNLGGLAVFDEVTTVMAGRKRTPRVNDA